MSFNFTIRKQLINSRFIPVRRKRKKESSPSSDSEEEESTDSSSDSSSSSEEEVQRRRRRNRKRRWVNWFSGIIGKWIWGVYGLPPIPPSLSSVLNWGLAAISLHLQQTISPVNHSLISDTSVLTFPCSLKVQYGDNVNYHKIASGHLHSSYTYIAKLFLSNSPI